MQAITPKPFLQSLAILSALILVGCANTPPPVSKPSVAFSDADRAVITRFYTEARRRPATAPAALFKPGDVLTSGARPQPLPTELQVQLPNVSPPFTRLLVGADVILINRDNHAIADVIPAVAY